MRRHLLTVAILILMAASPCLGQAPVPPGETGGGVVLEGTISDPDGGLLPGVVVEAINEQTGAMTSAMTGADGRFRLSGLPAGTYTVRANLDGFASTEQTGVLLRGGQATSLSLSLGGGPVPPGETAPSGSTGGGGGTAPPPVPESALPRVTKLSFSDDLELQAWLNARIADGRPIAAVLPAGPGSSLFVLGPATASPPACTVISAREPLEPMRLQRRLGLQQDKVLVGLHWLDSDSYALVLCDER